MQGTDSTPPASGVSQGLETPPLARVIIDQSMSPFCPGLTLQACPSPSADSLRKAIVARVRSGESKDAILSGLYADFGTAIRGAPEPSGFGLVGWLAPGFVLLAAAAVLTFWLRRRTVAARANRARNSNGGPNANPASPALSEAERDRLGALLRHDR
jgi:cytochrome c-type biogenesis protein CcmH/NrfF